VLLDPALWAEIRKVAVRYNVSLATVVLTACLEFLAAHGIALGQDHPESP